MNDYETKLDRAIQSIRRVELSSFTPKEWIAIRKQILRRDKYVCQRCSSKTVEDNPLTVHHIVPRSERGGNQPDNLITLCNKCHDWVEIRWKILNTAQSIKGSICPDMYTVMGIGHKKSDTRIIWDEQDTTEEPEDFHSWVYGGARRPPNRFRCNVCGRIYSTRSYAALCHPNVTDITIKRVVEFAPPDLSWLDKIRAECFQGEE